MSSNATPDPERDGRARAAALEGLRLAEVVPTAVVEFVSRGRCLVVGDEAAALEFARRLPGDLDCIVAVPGHGSPRSALAGKQRVVRGGRPIVRGALGDFEVGLATDHGSIPLGSLVVPPVDRFDLVVDLGTPPLLRQAMPPLGYYAPGDDPAVQADVLATLPQMRGEFEKPKYFDYDPEICAHGRNGKRGCTRCIDACPAEAIVSIGERVQVNPYLCQGGGACAMACPTGAMTYAYPAARDLLAALRRLLADYAAAGGTAPCLLFHDAASGAPLGQDLGEALPRRVLPVEIEEIGSVGMDVWLACLAYGADAVVMLTCDRTPAQVIEALQEQLNVAQALLAGMGYETNRLQAVNADQPVTARAAFTALPAGVARQPATFVAPPKDKRGTLRLALRHLLALAPAQRRVIDLPPGAPFGEVRVDAAKCTLCMSCASGCPTHALQDGRGLPQLNFREWNCVQCGICVRTCPEDAISLSARLLTDGDVRERPRTLHEEQPLCCVSCGKPFATRSMLDKLTRKLEGHWMFQSEEARKRLQMCEDCRVRDLFNAEAQRGRPGRN